MSRKARLSRWARRARWARCAVTEKYITSCGDPWMYEYHSCQSLPPPTMTDDMLSLLTIVLIVFAVLFVVSGVFLTVWQCLRYHYRPKLRDVEEGTTKPQLHPHNVPRQRLRDYTPAHVPDSTFAHAHDPNFRPDYTVKPLPPRPSRLLRSPYPPYPLRSPRLQRPAPTERAVPLCVAPNSGKPGLGLHPNPYSPPPGAPTCEQSRFSSDDEDDGDTEKEERKSQRKSKSWFPPKPLWSKGLDLQSPLHGARTRRVSSRRPHMVVSTSRFPQPLSHLGWSSAGPRVESAEVPIVSTPRDLHVDRPSPPDRMLGSPFQYRPQPVSEKRDTVLGPGDNLHRHHPHRAPHEHPSPSPELSPRQTLEQPHVL